VVNLLKKTQFYKRFTCSSGESSIYLQVDGKKDGKSLCEQ